jgi:hypothetical protein
LNSLGQNVAAVDRRLETLAEMSSAVALAKQVTESAAKRAEEIAAQVCLVILFSRS